MLFQLTLVSFLQYDRLRKLHAELEEKLEASEIQIKRQTAEYRTLLQQKDVCKYGSEQTDGRKDRDCFIVCSNLKLCYKIGACSINLVCLSVSES